MIFSEWRYSASLASPITIVSNPCTFGSAIVLVGFAVATAHRGVQGDANTRPRVACGAAIFVACTEEWREEQCNPRDGKSGLVAHACKLLKRNLC